MARQVSSETTDLGDLRVPAAAHPQGLWVLSEGHLRGGALMCQ